VRGQTGFRQMEAVVRPQIALVPIRSLWPRIRYLAELRKRFRPEPARPSHGGDVGLLFLGQGSLAGDGATGRVFHPEAIQELFEASGAQLHRDARCSVAVTEPRRKGIRDRTRSTGHEIEVPTNQVLL